jgi:hypothetical protein
MVERAAVAELRALAPCALGEQQAVRVLSDERRRRVEALGLAAGDEVKIASGGGKQRELEARRAGVDDGNRVNGITPVCARRTTVRSVRE